MFQMNPAHGVYSPPKKRLRRGQLAGYKEKRDFAKMMDQNMSPGTMAYFRDVRTKAKEKRDARESVKAKRDARRMRREMKQESLDAKRDARVIKRRRAAARGPINERTMSPGTIDAIMQRHQKAGAAALMRRMRDPAFAARYRQKVLGQKYRQGGRLLGATYKAPVEKRKTRRMRRIQGGVGLRKGDLAGLVGMNGNLMRAGDYASKASLMDYAQLMRDKARAAYVARKRRMGKGSAVRTPMTNAQKKAKRADAYKKKKATMAALAKAAMMPQIALSPIPSMDRNNHYFIGSPVSSMGALSDLGSAQFSKDPSPPRPRTTRARASAAASARAARRTIPPTNRTTRSMAPRF